MLLSSIQRFPALDLVIVQLKQVKGERKQWGYPNKRLLLFSIQSSSWPDWLHDLQIQTRSSKIHHLGGMAQLHQFTFKIKLNFYLFTWLSFVAIITIKANFMLKPLSKRFWVLFHGTSISPLLILKYLLLFSRQVNGNMHKIRIIIYNFMSLQHYITFHCCAWVGKVRSS